MSRDRPDSGRRPGARSTGRIAAEGGDSPISAWQDAGDEWRICRVPPPRRRRGARVVGRPGLLRVPAAGRRRDVERSDGLLRLARGNGRRTLASSDGARVGACGWRRSREAQDVLGRVDPRGGDPRGAVGRTVGSRARNPEWIRALRHGHDRPRVVSGVAGAGSRRPRRLARPSAPPREPRRFLAPPNSLVGPVGEEQLAAGLSLFRLRISRGQGGVTESERLARTRMSVHGDTPAPWSAVQ